MRPSLRELENAAWQALYTGITTAGALLLAPSLTGINASAFEAAQGAFIASVLSVFVEFARRQLRRGGVEPPGDVVE